MNQQEEWLHLCGLICFELKVNAGPPFRRQRDGSIETLHHTPSVSDFQFKNRGSHIRHILDTTENKLELFNLI